MRRPSFLIFTIFNLALIFGCTSATKHNVIREIATSNVTYYVNAKIGDDQNDGLSEAKAWKSISKVNGTNLRPGNTVLFKRNQEWTEKLVVRYSGAATAPITFSSFGTGSFPIISGALVVSKNEWSEVKKNIWATSLTQDDDREPERIFVDGAPLNDHLLKETSIELSKELEWAWENVNGGTLYIFSKISPSRWGKLIEVNVLRYAINLGSQKFIRIYGFKLTRAREGLWIGGDNNEISHISANQNSFTGIHVTGSQNLFREFETSGNGVNIMPGRTDARGLGTLVEGSFNEFLNFSSNDNSEDGVQTSPSSGGGNRFINARMKGNRENCFDFKAGDQEINGGILLSDATSSADCILVHKVPHHVKIEKVHATATTKGPALNVTQGASVEVTESTLVADESSAVLIGESAGDGTRIINNTIGPGGRKSKILIDVRGGKQHVVLANTLRVPAGIESVKVSPAAEATVNSNKTSNE